MTNIRMVFCTCGTAGQARAIASALVNEHLAACVSILPGAVSIYRWEGTVESAQELLLIIKTTSERFDKLRERIVQLHSYDTPEILSVPVSEGSDSYLRWVREAAHQPPTCD